MPKCIATIKVSGCSPAKAKRLADEIMGRIEGVRKPAPASIQHLRGKVVETYFLSDGQKVKVERIDPYYHLRYQGR